MIKYAVLAIVSLVITFLLKEKIPVLGYSAYKDTLGALLSISSIIFAIIGAWIAIIYPRAIGRVFSGPENTGQKIKEADTDADYLSELVEIVMVSAFVLMVVLTIQFSAPLIKELLSIEYFNEAKYIAFFIVLMLTLAQLQAVFRVILANYFFLNDLRKKNVNAKVEVLHE